jgi:hypothetical protein
VSLRAGCYAQERAEPKVPALAVCRDRLPYLPAGGNIAGLSKAITVSLPPSGALGRHVQSGAGRVSATWAPRRFVALNMVPGFPLKVSQ